MAKDKLSFTVSRWISWLWILSNLTVHAFVAPVTHRRPLRSSIDLNAQQRFQEKSNDEAQQLLQDAERLRLEAETMDANLTLEKISILEEKLSNNAWLEKQNGQTVKDLYEELRRLEQKVSRSEEPSPAASEKTPSVAPQKASTTREPSSRSNRNLPPMAGFDDSDLDLYIPVAEDVNRMAPNATLNERIGLFRDAPELQAHFKQKIQNLILGPLEEMQELETLKQEYFSSSSSKEREALLKQIKRLEAKVEENTIREGSGGGGNGGIGYSDNIRIPPDRLPALSETELEERYQTIRGLPDILVAIYLQRNGLYDIPVSISTIKLEVGKGGVNVESNVVEEDDNTNVTEETEPVDLYEKLKLGIQLDYYDLQLQLLDQARAIPLTDDMRKDFVAAYRSLPTQVRQHYLTERLGIDSLDAKIIDSDEDEDVEVVLKEVLQPMDESLSAFSKAAGSFLKGPQVVAEESVVPPEYNDVEFVDRSRYLEEFFPSIALLEDERPSPEEVDLFVTDCLTSDGKPFMVTSKPERVIGGYYIRGTNQMTADEKTFTTANDRLVKEVSRRLEKHPTLKDKIEFYYILNPSPPTDEDMELEVSLDPLFVVTAKDPNTMYRPSSVVTKTAVTVSGLLSMFFFSLGSCVLNPKINSSIEQALDSISSQGSTTVLLDIDWFYNLCLPLYFSSLAILLAHELGHRIAASVYKFDIGFPNVIPSLTVGVGGSITPLKSPPPNNKALFDFSIAGPLSGLAVSIGLLFVGMELTRQVGLDANFPVLPVDLARSSSFGGGIIQYFLGKYAILPDQGPGAFVELHPFAISGFLGCLINALALLPLGHTDGGRISLAMFGRRGAFVVKLFTTLLLTVSGLFGLDEVNILLAYVIFSLIWQRELESPIRNEVDELSFSRGLLGISSAILVGLILIPMSS